MLFLVDENLPTSLAEILKGFGFEAECVADTPAIHGKPDEAIFDYAVSKRAVLVTRDVGFVNPLRFPLGKLEGVILIRFPNEVSTSALCREVARLLESLRWEDFRNLIIVEPGSVRRRKL